MRLVASLLAALASAPALAATPAPQVDRIEGGMLSSVRSPLRRVPEPVLQGWKGQIDLGPMATVEGDEAVVGAVRGLLRDTSDPRRLLRIGIERTGTIVACHAYHLGADDTFAPASDDFSGALCAAVRDHAVVTLRKGFVMPGPTGWFTIDFDYLDNPDVAKPVELAEGRRGIPVIAMRTDKPGGYAGCSLDARHYDAQTEAALCALWTASLKGQGWRTSDGRYLPAYGRAAIYVRRAGSDTASELRLKRSQLLSGWQNAPVFDAVADAADALTETEGKLALPITSDDYPVAALRSGLEGRSGIEMRFDATGRIASCRPIVTSGASELDNAACLVALRRARWVAAPGATGFADRPARIGVTWVQPD